MSESPALRILVITSRPLVTVEPTRENGELTFIRHPIALKPLRHVRQELERALKGMDGPVAVRYLARAKGIDGVTQGGWELEAWVKASMGRRSVKTEEKGSKTKKRGSAESSGKVL